MSTDQILTVLFAFQLPFDHLWRKTCGARIKLVKRDQPRQRPRHGLGGRQPAQRRQHGGQLEREHERGHDENDWLCSCHFQRLQRRSGWAHWTRRRIHQGSGFLDFNFDEGFRIFLTHFHFICHAKNLSACTYLTCPYILLHIVIFVLSEESTISTCDLWYII